MSTTSYFGRVWSIKITPQATGETLEVSNSTWDPNALRCTFNIEQTAMTRYWYADITIYNSLPSMAQVIQAGDTVTVEAGYQSPGAGLIFQGQVFQPLWERENNTDYKLTLHCLVGLFEDKSGYVSTIVPAGSTDWDAVFQVANAAKPRAIPIESLDADVLRGKPYPRAQAVNGRARAFFDDIASKNNLEIWMSPKGLNIRSLAPQSDTPEFIYSPPFSPASATVTTSGTNKSTLIGTPQQTELGVTFTTLLDSGVKIGSLIKLESVLTSRLPQYPMQLRFFDPSGLYVIAGIRHTGDTRGNDWYTEITGVVRNWDKIRRALQLQ